MHPTMSCQPYRTVMPLMTGMANDEPATLSETWVVTLQVEMGSQIEDLLPQLQACVPTRTGLVWRSWCLRFAPVPVATVECTADSVAEVTFRTEAHFEHFAGAFRALQATYSHS